jgi:hypothetical protein
VISEKRSVLGLPCSVFQAIVDGLYRR